MKIPKMNFSNRVVLSLFLFAVLNTSSLQAEDWIYTTRPGDNLWNISKQYLQDESQWMRIQQYNQISNPKKMPPGKKIRIPYDWLKQQPVNAVLVSFRGDVKVLNKDGQAVTTGSGITLGLGSSVVTGVQSTAVIEFADKSTLFVRENSTIRLDTISFSEKSAIVDTRIRLNNGRVESRVIPFQKTNSRFEVITPTAVAAVRGTVFRVDLDNDNTMLNEVVEGQIKLHNEFGETLVPAGFGTVVQKGQAPKEPEALLNAPDLSLLDKIILTEDLQFRWSDVEGAEQYRVIISSVSQPLNIVLDERIFKSGFKWSAPQKGQYTIQVRGIAKSGLQGIPAMHSFHYGLEDTTSLSAPRLNTPSDGFVAQSNIPTLHWYNVEGAEQYRVQFSDKADFSVILFDQVVEKQFYALPTRLNAGVYYWRVAGLSAAPAVGPYSDVFKLTIQQ